MRPYAGSVGAEELLETGLRPWVEQVVRSWDVPGLVLSVVDGDGDVATLALGTRDRRTGEPVTPGTFFHLASVSKTAVATAMLRLVGQGRLELDAPVTAYLPDVSWADPRAQGITVAHLLSHTSGLGDVPDYGWHEPQTDAGALERHVRTVAGWSLQTAPGERFAYSNAGFEVLGHLLAVLEDQPFEDCLAEGVLRPARMPASTFSPAELPDRLRARPHLGLPPQVVPGVYPYTRQHAPSSSLHSSGEELASWMRVHLGHGPGLLDPAGQALLHEPRVPAGEGLFDRMALGWFVGRHRGHRVVGHPGSDPGFQSLLVLVPERGLGVCVLVDANTAPVFATARAALDVLLGLEREDVPLPPVGVALGPVLSAHGVAAAVDRYRALETEHPPSFDLDDEDLEEGVWGLIELHRTDLARPLLDLWTSAQPRSARAWLTTAWAHEVDGRLDLALPLVRRALALSPVDDDALALLRRLEDG